jgi:DeoR family glycerol-3-phosphate regulon repressor
MNTKAEAKRKIATEVARMVRNGDSLFLDTGSTTAYIAAALQDHLDLFVVTNSLTVAQSLATRNNNRVYFAGGLLRSHDGGSFGLEAADFVRKFRVQYAFFSVGAINADQGFMLHDHEEAEFARQIARQATMRIVVADSSKFGRTAPMILDAASQYHCLVTDADPPADIADVLRKTGMDIRIAGQ